MPRSDATSRVIDASTDRVFAALVDPDALVDWLPPTGMTGHFDYFDARAGGSYRMSLTYAEAPAAGGKSTNDSDVVEARFVEITPRVRVVHAVDFDSSDPILAGTMLMTWSVTAVEGGTLVEIRADDVPSAIASEDHLAGMRSSLANLADYLAGTV